MVDLDRDSPRVVFINRNPTNLSTVISTDCLVFGFIEFQQKPVIYPRKNRFRTAHLFSFCLPATDGINNVWESDLSERPTVRPSPAFTDAACRSYRCETSAERFQRVKKVNVLLNFYWKDTGNYKIIFFTTRFIITDFLKQNLLYTELNRRVLNVSIYTWWCK